MRTTIKDIARATGLSVTTISLVLNDKPNKIADDTKKLVRETAKKMNYIPNQMAQSLVRNASQTIGLILPDITNMYFAEMAKSIQDAARSRGYSLILCNSDGDVKKQEESIRTLFHNGVMGIIMALSSTGRENDSSFALINELKIPAILIDENAVEYDIDSVLVDETYGAYAATQYLLDMGHRRIGVITGPEKVQSTYERLAGYKKALKENNIEIDEELIYYGDYKISSGEKGSEVLWKKDISAIFSFNDMMACGIYKYAAREKIVIPDDISVIGFDNISFAELLYVPLTTVDQPLTKIGGRAVEKLLERIDDPQKKITVEVYKPTIIERNSTKKREERT